MNTEQMYWELFELAMRDFENSIKDMRVALDKLKDNVRELKDGLQ